MALFGVEPYQGDYHTAAGWLPLLLNLFTYALLPALVEETVYRGWITAALQPFGERRALLLSAIFFGLAHGNLTQLPFAFFLGLLFGYLFLRTGRLWPGMLLHFLNNALSVLLDTAAVYLDHKTYAVVQMAAFAAIVLAGAVAGLLLTANPAFKKEVYPLTDRRHAREDKKRRRMMWWNPAVVATLVVYLALTIGGEVLG